MIVFNEFGYYKEDGYGIWVENFQVVIFVVVFFGGEWVMLGFEIFIMVFIYKGLIDLYFLILAELVWMDVYYVEVCQCILLLVEGEVVDWLFKVIELLVGVMF